MLEGTCDPDTVPHPSQGLRRLRQRRQREADKEARRLPPTARRPSRRGGNPQSHSPPERGCPDSSGLRESRPGGAPGDRRIGVVWHNQGSGKSLTMAFYTGVIVREPAMENPTIVVLTDRNDLDGQLFGTFSRCQRPTEAGRQAQADSRADLRQ